MVFYVFATPPGAVRSCVVTEHHLQWVHESARARCREGARIGVPACSRLSSIGQKSRRLVTAARSSYHPQTVVSIPPEINGWWRIVDTGTWVNDGLDDLARHPSLLSLTGSGDMLRMHCLLAYVNVRPTKTGVSFTWQGAWEYDPVSGTGSARLGKDGRLRGRIRIKDGDESTFLAERAEQPGEPIPDPPSYRDKWRRW